MSADFDVLLLDAAPLLAVSDTVAMLNAVDGVLIVSREGQATKEAALRVRQIMDRTSAVKLGVLANDVTGAEVERYNYGYGGHQPGL